MTLFSLLYSVFIIVLCSVGLIGFGILYYLRREKRDLLLSFYFLLNLIYEIIRSISDNVPGGYIDFHSPRSLISVVIIVFLTLLYYFIYANQIRAPIAFTEKVFLCIFYLVILSLSAFQSTIPFFYDLLPCGFILFAWKLRKQRKENRRSCVMFWIAILCIGNMLLSLIVDFAASDSYALSLRRKSGPFDLLINVDLVFLTVVAAAYVDLFISIKRYMALSKEGKQAPAAVDFHSLSREVASEYGLTKRETEILDLLIEGSSYDEISEKLYIAGGTVKVHIHNIYRKLGVSSRSQINSLLIERSGKHLQN